LIFLLIVLPAANIYLFILAVKDIQKLDNEELKQIFGFFYEDFEKKRKNGLLYMLIYILRREIFVLVAFSMAKSKYQAC